MTTATTDSTTRITTPFRTLGRRRPRLRIIASGSVWAPSIGRDFPGSKMLAAGDERPERLLRRAAAARAADGGDGAHHRRHGQDLQQPTAHVGDHGPLGQGGEAQTGDGRRAYILVMAEVQHLEAVVGLAYHLAHVGSAENSGPRRM